MWKIGQRRVFVGSVVQLAALGALAACGERGGVAPLAPASTPSAALVPLDQFGILGLVPPGRACTAPAYHQFDFWLGSWNVVPTGSPPADPNVVGSTNVIVGDVDGCAVEENWTAANGVRGRSLNAYDASTDSWSEMWVAAPGGGGTPLLLEGGIRGASMIMTGLRPFPGFPIVDSITWTPLASGSVRQQGSAHVEGALFGSYDLRYDRASSVTPAPETHFTVCELRALSRQFDFMLGSWDLYEGQGTGQPQGTSTVTSDLSGCLIEEHVTGLGGYKGVSYATWGLARQRWDRTYVDNRGLRLALAGGRDGSGSMVLAGSKPGAGGKTIDVRLTWQPLSADRVEQRWEFSRDGGATWLVEQTVTMVRRSTGA